MGFSLILRAFFSFPNERQFIECQFFWEFRNIPFVIMSGSEDVRIVSMSTKRGAIFCSKTHPDLLSVIKRAANIEDQKE